MAVNYKILNKAREIEKQLQSPLYLEKQKKEAERQARIKQYQTETEQLRKGVNIPLETIKGMPSAAEKVGKGIWSGIKTIGRYLGKAIKHPKETAAGVFGEAVFEPTIGATRLLLPKKYEEKVVPKMEEGLKEYYEEFAPTKEAREVGKFLGWMMPYSTTEKVISKIPAITKLGKLAPVVKELGAWISTDQLLYNPKTDGSRAKQVLEDLAAFGILKGAGKLFKLVKERFAVKVADEVIKPIENAMKRGEKVPLEEVEKAVSKAKKIIKAGTGKEPKELVKRKIAKSIKPKTRIKIIPKTKKPVLETISKAKGIKLPKAKKPVEAKIEGIPKEKIFKSEVNGKLSEQWEIITNTPKTLRLKLVKESPTIWGESSLKNLAEKNNGIVRIDKTNKGKHLFKQIDKETFVIYPNRTGVPIFFSKIEKKPSISKGEFVISQDVIDKIPLRKENGNLERYIKIGNKEYRIGELNSGEIYLEPISWKGGETEGFSPDTIFFNRKGVGTKLLSISPFDIETMGVSKEELEKVFSQAIKGAKEVKPKIKPKIEGIPKELEPLKQKALEIAKKYPDNLEKGAEEFERELVKQKKELLSKPLTASEAKFIRSELRAPGFKSKIKTGHIPNPALQELLSKSIRKFQPEDDMRRLGITLTDFYNQVVKGVKKAKLPEFPEKPSKSIELNASVVPGAKAISNFIDRDVVKPIKGKISFFSKAKFLVKNWLNPPSDKKIKEATQIFLRQMKADIQQFKDQLWNTMDKRLKWWEKVPEEAKLTFINKVEKGTITTKDFLEFGKDKAKVFADIAKEYRERLDKIYNLQKKYGDKISYIENYFPHIWEKPKEAQRFISSYIRKIGKPAFMKKRYYDFIKDGMEAGLKLRTTNPEELVIMREIGGYQYLKIKEFLNRMKEQGWLKFNKGLKRPPFGWKALDRNALKVYFPTEKGVVQAGEWIMPEPAANVVNNYLSPSLWSSPEWYGKVFRGFMKSKNMVVTVKLGLSTFHMVETTMSDLATNLTIALKKAGRKDFKGFLRTLAKTPIGPIESMRAGRIIEAWEKGPKTDWEKQAVNLIKRAGGRPRMSNIWRIQAEKQWKKAIDEFKTGNPIGGTIRIIPEILEAIQAPILDWYVPRLKVSNFLRLAKDYIAAHPNISEHELDKYLTKLWDSIDNRFGQLVYDNLFWKRWIRDLGVASSLSMGWNLGTIREFGGGALDFAKFIAKIATKQGKAEITDRMIYSITYPLVFGTLGGLITYISTGKSPKELLDYFYPKTGNKNPDGSDERLQMPTMMKEFFSSKSALQKYGIIKGTAIYAWHKTNPLISIGWDILANKNFYGVEIRDENAPAVKQAKQIAEYFGKEALAPISISGYLRQKKISGKSSIVPFIGFTPAPKYITETPIQSKIYVLYSKRFGGRVKTKEEWKKTQVKSEIRMLYLQGKNKEMKEKLKEAIKKGYIKNVSQFFKSCDLPSDIKAFKALPIEDQKALIAQMSLKDLERYAWYCKKDLKSHFSKISKNAKEFVKLYKQGKIKKPIWKKQKLQK